MVPAPPRIYAPQRRDAAIRRSVTRQAGNRAARFLFDDVAEDIGERLAFLRHSPARALVVGDVSGAQAADLAAMGCSVESVAADAFDLELPYAAGGFDLVVTVFALDTVNDLPGALIHQRAALNQGGLAVAVLLGAGSLPALRQTMLAADGERPAPRLHPQIDVRAGGQLLQRAGWGRPVVDSRSLRVRYGAFDTLSADLRDQGLTNCLADPGPGLTKSSLQRACAAWNELADSEGRVTETFEILTLSGWRA